MDDAPWQGSKGEPTAWPSKPPRQASLAPAPDMPGAGSGPELPPARTPITTKPTCSQ